MIANNDGEDQHGSRTTQKPEPYPGPPKEKCRAQFVWRSERVLNRGTQAVQIALARRRLRKHGATFSKELFVCKCYNIDGTRSQGVSGPKYVLREWEMLRMVKHPDILRFEDFSYDSDGWPRFASLYTEYCSVGDLSQFDTSAVSRDQQLSPNEVGQVLYQLANALMYIHYGIHKSGRLMKSVNAMRTIDDEVNTPPVAWRAILHRDIKPSNVFVKERSDGTIKVKLGDFGIATYDAQSTQTYIGTTEYLAPEQRTNNSDGRKTTVMSDVYSLGLTMRKVFTLAEHEKYADATGGPLSVCIEALIEDCQKFMPTQRPTSVQILDQLKPFMEPENPHWLLFDAFASLFDWPQTHDRDTLPCTHPASLCEVLLAYYPRLDISHPEVQHIMSAATRFAQKQVSVSPDSLAADAVSSTISLHPIKTTELILRLVLNVNTQPEKQTPDSETCPIKFKDAVGRKFSFPWHLCKTWKGMESLINQAFLHVDIIGQHVQQGHYDLMGPDGEIILPQVWDVMIKPDWEVSMHMWPIFEMPRKEKKGIAGEESVVTMDANGVSIGDMFANMTVEDFIRMEPAVQLAKIEAAKKARTQVATTAVDEDL